MFNCLIVLFIFIILNSLFKNQRMGFFRKIFFSFFFFFFFIFYLKNFLNDFLNNELFFFFWLNISFIIHVLLLPCLYNYFYSKKKEYICFIITRISFIFSLSCLLYLFNLFYRFLQRQFNDINLSNYTIILDIILTIMTLFVTFIIIILYYFVYIIHLYYNFILGRNLLLSNTEKPFIRKKILKHLLLVLFSFSLKIYFNLPIIYIIFILIFLYDLLLNLLKYFFVDKSEIKFNKSNLKWINIHDHLLSSTSIINLKVHPLQEKLFKIYNEPYNDCFIFGMRNYIYVFKPKWNLIWNFQSVLYYVPLPMYNSPFKYKSWKDLAIHCSIYTILLYDKHTGLKGLPKTNPEWINFADKVILYHTKFWSQDYKIIRIEVYNNFHYVRNKFNYPIGSIPTGLEGSVFAI